MTSLSRIALGASLAFGALAITGAPALAAKEKEQKTAKPVLSKEFQAAIAAAQTAVKSGNTADAQAKLAAAEPLAQQPDEKFYFGAISYDLYKITKDPATGRKAIDSMLGSGSKLMTNAGELNFASGQMAVQANDFQTATQRFAAAEQAGYNKDANALLLGAESNFKLNQVQPGLALIDRAVAFEIAAGRKPPENWYARAASQAYKAKLNGEVAKWTGMQVKAYPTGENWRSALVTYRDSSRLDGQVQLDLFRLMRQTKSLKGERDYFEYAALASDRALPGEAKSTIEQGYAAEPALKSSRAITETLAVANGKIAADRASLAASEKQANGAAGGRTAKGTADGYLGYGDDAKAIAMYRLALQKGGVDVNEVNTRLGIALARSGQKEEARKAFAAVTGPRADVAKFWTLYLDTVA